MSETLTDSNTLGAPENVVIALDGRGMPALMTEVERKVLAWAMTEAQGNQRQAAQLLDLSYSTFVKKLARHNLRAIWS